MSLESHRTGKHVTSIFDRATTTSPHLSGGLPPGFIALTGTYGSWTLVPENSDRQNPDHIYLHVSSPVGAQQGLFEAAINIHSNDGTNIMFYQFTENVPVNSWPAAGVNNGAQSSYGGMDLTNGQFQSVDRNDVLSLLESYSTNCDLLSIFGTVYSGNDAGTGLDFVHFNPEEGQDVTDGMAVFYFKDGGSGTPVARTIYFKFDNQTID